MSRPCLDELVMLMDIGTDKNIKNKKSNDARCTDSKNIELKKSEKRRQNTLVHN